MTVLREWLIATFFVSFLFGPSAAFGQSDAQRVEARARFDRGITLFNEGHEEAALAEFEQAYRLAPAYQVLYNIGKAHGALGHAVEAVDALERYLAEGGTNIPEERRDEATGELDRQRARVGMLDVQCNIENATVSVDGNDLAATPLPSPIRVSVGSHTVSVRAPGYETAQRVVAVAGGVSIPLSFTLRPILEARGALRIRSNLADVDVRVDGESVGTTPLDSTVAVDSGRRVIEGERRGYRTQRLTVEVPTGLEVDVNLEMERNPEAAIHEIGVLRLNLPSVPYVLRIDGESVDSASGNVVELPVGRHEIAVEAHERRPYRGSVTVSAETPTDFAPRLQWTDEARTSRMESAAAQRTWGWTTAIAGAVLAGGGTGVFIWNGGVMNDNETEIAALTEERNACHSDDCGFDELGVQIQELNDEQYWRSGLKWAMLGTAAAGTISLVTGIILLVGADSDESIEAEASGRTAARVTPFATPNEAGVRIAF